MITRAMRERSTIELIQWGYHRSLGILTGRMRILPDFIIIGAQRCGTTSLFYYLSQHPDVYASFPKEVHFFSNYYQKGINWYRSHFPLYWQKSRLLRNSHHNFMTGEATPYYLSHPHAPQRVFETVPDVLLIVLLRNPIERAYSHYQHEVKMGAENLSFEEAIDKEEERLTSEVGKLIEDKNYRSFNHQHFSYLSRGIYVDQIEAWSRYFHPEQLLILNSEHFNEYPGNVLRVVREYLGLANWELTEYKKYHAARYIPMQMDTRERLTRFFEPHNQRLYEYLDINFGWE